MRIGSQSSLAAGQFRTDTRGLHVFVDRRWCELAGLPADQAKGEGWVEALHASDRDRVLREWGEAVEAKTKFRSEYRMRHSDALVLSRAELATGLNGRPHGFIGAITDVSSLRERQIELEYSLAQLSATLETLNDGILVLDHSGRQQTGNTRFFELLDIAHAGNVDADNLSFRIMQKLKNPHDYHCRMSELHQQSEAESEAILEMKDGRTLHLSSRPQRVHGCNTGRMWSLRDVTAIRQSEARLAERAYHDALTGLPNRYLLHDRMTQAMARANRDKKTLAVLFVDLDHFKKINDRLGHFGADRMLKETAARISKCVREVDTVARIGGDEFVVLLSVVNEAHDAGEVAVKILHSLSMPFDEEARVSASIGISLSEGDDENCEALLQRADAAMYHAKRCGRNRYRYYSSTINQLSAHA